MPVTINASKNGSGNSQPDLANKDLSLLKSPQVAGYLLARLLTHPPQAPERCRANLLYCETRKLEMRNTAQIWWAQDSRRGKTVLFSGLFITSFRKWKPFVSYKEGDDNVACKSKPIVTSPNHCNGTKAPRKGYLPPWAPIPQQAYATLPKVGHPQKPGHPPRPTSGHLPRPAVAKFPSLQTESDRQTSRGCVPSVLRSP
jgi:hypothetical protein